MSFLWEQSSFKTRYGCILGIHKNNIGLINAKFNFSFKIKDMRQAILKAGLVVPQVAFSYLLLTFYSISHSIMTFIPKVATQTKITIRGTTITSPLVEQKRGKNVFLSRHHRNLRQSEKKKKSNPNWLRKKLNFHCLQIT